MSFKSYESLLEKVETVRDALDTPIDTEVKHIVAALWLNNFETSGSCAGHADRMDRGPYIHISPLQNDKLRLKYKEFDALLAEHKQKEARDLKQQIYDESLNVYARLFTILQHFYTKNPATYENTIILYPQFNGEIYLLFNGARTLCTLSKEQQQMRLKQLHRELDKFAQFLVDNAKNLTTDTNI